jgi:glycosyltransferase involved in cell wall biosynthesis
MIEVLLFGLSDNMGGIETYLKKIWDNIDKSRFHFNFIDMTGANRQACFYDELSQSGATFYKITPRRESVLKNRRDLNRLFKEHHFDIFHFNVNTLSYLVPVEVALKNGCAVVVHSRNAGASKNKITRLLHVLNKKRLQRMPVHRIAVSPLAGDWLFGSSNFDVFFNGVDTQRFQYTDENRKKIREEQRCTDKLVIGNVGAFTPAKNHRFMVDVFEKVKEKNPDMTIWAVEPENAAILAGGSIGTHVQMGIGDGIIPEILHQNIYGDICIITDEEAMTMARRLAREEGILCGISAGTNVAAAVKLAKSLGPGKTVVTVLPDTAERYFSTPLFEGE